MAKSTRKRASRKAVKRPPKPYDDFPLYAHPLGYWSKKINGKIRHFGRWGRIRNGRMETLEGDTWRPALDKYKAQAADLYAGREPAENLEGLTVGSLGNRFLSSKKRRELAGELSRRTYQELQATCDRIVSAFGRDRRVDDLRAGDFERLRASIAEQWGPVRLGNEITRIRSVFKYAFDNGLIETPVRYGSEFRKPSRSVLRRHKATGGPRLFTRDELLAILKELKPDPVMKAMVLLGLNVGFGNSDVANLQQSHVDLDGGWVDFPRPKTGIPRRASLWPETVTELRAAIAIRPQPKHEDDAGCVFLTSQRRRFVRTTEKSKTDAVSVQFGKLLRKLGINGRKGLGFYTLRHNFRTVADGCRDQIAVDHAMGHCDNSMAGVYREAIEDDRLVAVADHVRRWLWPRRKVR